MMHYFDMVVVLSYLVALFGLFASIRAIRTTLILRAKLWERKHAAVKSHQEEVNSSIKEAHNGSIK